MTSDYPSGFCPAGLHQSARCSFSLFRMAFFVTEEVVSGVSATGMSFAETVVPAVKRQSSRAVVMPKRLKMRAVFMTGSFRTAGAVMPLVADSLCCPYRPVSESSIEKHAGYG